MMKHGKVTGKSLFNVSVGLVSLEMLICVVFLVNVCVIIHSTGGCQHQLAFGASGQSVSATSVSQTALGPAVKQVVGTWTARTTAGKRSSPFGPHWLD